MTVVEIAKLTVTSQNTVKEAGKTDRNIKEVNVKRCTDKQRKIRLLSIEQT